MPRYARISSTIRQRGNSGSCHAACNGAVADVQPVVISSKVQEIELPRKPSLSKHLRNARIKRGLSVAELAEQVGVSQSSIYFWETDRVRPRDANLSALCKVLKLPVRATRAMAVG